MWNTAVLRDDILDEFRDAQYPMLERCNVRRARKALALRRRQLAAYKLRRALDRYLRRPASAIEPLPPVPLNAGARRMQEIWAERRRTAGAV